MRPRRHVRLGKPTLFLGRPCFAVDPRPSRPLMAGSGPGRLRFDRLSRNGTFFPWPGHLTESRAGTSPFLARQQSYVLPSPHGWGSRSAAPIAIEAAMGSGYGMARSNALGEWRKAYPCRDKAPPVETREALLRAVSLCAVIAVPGCTAFASYLGIIVLEIS